MEKAFLSPECRRVTPIFRGLWFAKLSAYQPAFHRSTQSITIINSSLSQKHSDNHCMTTTTMHLTPSTSTNNADAMPTCPPAPSGRCNPLLAPRSTAFGGNDMNRDMHHQRQSLLFPVLPRRSDRKRGIAQFVDDVADEGFFIGDIMESSTSSSSPLVSRLPVIRLQPRSPASYPISNTDAVAAVIPTKSSRVVTPQRSTNLSRSQSAIDLLSSTHSVNNVASTNNLASLTRSCSTTNLLFSPKNRYERSFHQNIGGKKRARLERRPSFSRAA